MRTIRLGPFRGAIKAPNPRLVPDGVGVESLNHNPSRGDLRPWRVPLVSTTAPAGTKTLTLLGREATSDTKYWMTWNTVVHAVRSLNAEDATKRTYYTGSGAPKSTDNLIGLAGAPYPTAYRDLGVPRPLTPPTLTEVTPGTGDDEERFYAYTYITDWDEEGPPAVSAVFTCKPGAIIDITALAAPPSGAGENRGINRIRIYRTVAGDTGATFYLLREISVATSSQDDARDVSATVLESTFYNPPPSTLKNLIGLWNGMMAGIYGKSVRFCEPYKPHAWPPAYEALLHDTPVALGAFDKSLLVLTTGKPRLIFGSAPEAMDDVPVEFNAACVSAQSAVSLGHGVAWATSDGLAYVGQGAPRLLTAGLMTEDDWRALNPETMVGCQYGGLYFAFYYTGAVWKGLCINPLDPKGIYFLDTGYAAAHYDELEEKMWVLDGTNICEWDAGASLMTVLHRTGVMRLSEPGNPGAAEIVAEEYPVTLKMWAGRYSAKTGWPSGSLKITKTVSSQEPFNLPSGYLADDVQFEISGAVEGIAGGAIADDRESLGLA